MNRVVLRCGARLAAGLACLAAAGAQAQVPPPPLKVMALSASASVEVNRDWLTLVLSTTREGVDAAGVQSQLRLALETALTEARKAAKPGQVEVSTGAFSLYPRYTHPAPGSSGGASRAIAGWQGSTELVIQGRDTVTIAQLAGRIQTLSIARVGFTLSREAREAVEGDVTAQAIARFRKQAETATRLFGFHDYTVREVALSGNDVHQPPPAPMKVRAMSAAAEEALPVEAGKALVTATVSGSVQMK